MTTTAEQDRRHQADRRSRNKTLRRQAANGDIRYRELSRADLWKLVLQGDANAEREYSRRLR